MYAIMPIDEILSRNAYLLTIEVRLFWFVALIYGVSFLLFTLHAITRGVSVGRGAQGLLWTGVVFHVALLLLRTVEGERAPFQTLYESLSWFACTAALTYLYVSRKWKDVYLPGTFVTLLAAGGCLFALLKRSPAINPLFPSLQSYWFEWHVILAFFSYAVFVVSSAIEVTYLIIKPFLKRGMARGYGLTLGSLDDFRGAALKLVIFGFPFLTFTLFSGAAWANEAWGRYWGWDPKETWALITWTVFAMYMHAMAVPAWRGAPASVLNLTGFVCMIMTFLGVNWLAKLFGIPSLHLYAV
jgi:cytochrome c-type biogenesis protein CcsB